MNIYSWSGGKDSTASIILDHMHGAPPSLVLFSEVMFDREQGVSGEHPEHINFITNVAMPLITSWGYQVEILRGDKDYIDCFNHVIKRSKDPKKNGKKYGHPIAGKCVLNTIKKKQLKIA